MILAIEYGFIIIAHAGELNKSFEERNDNECK